MNLDIEALTLLNAELKRRVDLENRRAKMMGFASKMMESFRQTSSNLMEEMGLNKEPDPAPRVNSLDEATERGRQYQKQHLALLRTQTQALRRWRDSL